ncbi:MAG: tyrosine-type recombinase/integrase [Anaerolineales bacterium]|nr:tyrosine-type recombinase/integrase [Anaerolineales bacterium]
MQFKMAEGRSPRTIVGYRHDLREWLAYAGDKKVETVDAQELRAFLNYLRTDYKPRRFSAELPSLSPKTIRNFWVTLSAFFTWLKEEFDHPSPMENVPAPRFAKPEVEPFQQEEIRALLKACEFKREAQTDFRRRFTMRRATAQRDQAIILMLLDTGLRSSELCALNMGDVDLKSGKVVVRHGPTGGAKGGKGRIVYLGKSAHRSVWRYTVTREDKGDESAPLFTAGNRHLTRDSLRQLIAHLGEAAQVKKCHPHRFRHTFAIAYLRAGGDLFTLQRLLGHSSLDMVQHYARVAQVDIEQAHRRASPADNWRL